MINKNFYDVNYEQNIDVLLVEIGILNSEDLEARGRFFTSIWTLWISNNRNIIFFPQVDSLHISLKYIVNVQLIRYMFENKIR